MISNWFLKFSYAIPVERYDHFCPKIKNYFPLRIDQCLHIESYKWINISTLGAKDRPIFPHWKVRIDQYFHIESKKQIIISTLGAKNRSIFPLWELQIDQFFQIESCEFISIFSTQGVMNGSFCLHQKSYTDHTCIFLKWDM